MVEDQQEQDRPVAKEDAMSANSSTIGGGGGCNTGTSGASIGLDAASETSSGTGGAMHQHSIDNYASRVPVSPRLSRGLSAGSQSKQQHPTLFGRHNSGNALNLGANRMMSSPSSNSLASELEVDNLAIIGDYDMKRSLSTQAFVLDRLSHMNSRKAHVRRSGSAGAPRGGNGGGGQNILAAHGYANNNNNNNNNNNSNSSFYENDRNKHSGSSINGSSRNGAGMAMGNHQQYGASMGGVGGDDDLDGLGDLATDVFGRSADVFMEGVDSIVDDNFWKCFEPNKPVRWNWNLYLGPLWALGVVIRYLILFPIRVLLLLLGWLLFALGMLVAHTVVPAGSSRRSIEHKLISFQCGVFTLTWGAVIRFHGTQVVESGGVGGKPKTNCVFVANHTSMIDVIILQQNRCFSLVGQKHKGIVKFLQDVVLGCLQCIWFDRGEIKDRAVVARRLTEHAKDVTRNPLLVFPEGTCVNNEYCIQFKKGVFELGVPIAPVAIRYHKMFVDPFWNSRSQSFVMHLVELMTSWCLICDVYYLEPQTIREGETGVEFASRVKSMIAKAGKLKNVEWDGYMKYWKPSKRYLDSWQKRNAASLRSIVNTHTQDVADGSASPYATPMYASNSSSMHSGLNRLAGSGSLPPQIPRNLSASAGLSGMSRRNTSTNSLSKMGAVEHGAGGNGLCMGLKQRSVLNSNVGSLPSMQE